MDVNMAPFANIGRWYREQTDKPQPGESKYAYAIWLSSTKGARYERNVTDYRKRETLRPRIVDSVEPGNSKSERSHGVQGEKTSVGLHQGKGWRHATGGGWFSYEIKVVPDQPMTLLCTWWGDEGGKRTFDILIDGAKIAAQTLLHDKPGEFFDVEYKIPPELTRGKQKVTVKFQAHAEATAGGVFGCAMLK